MNPDPHPAQQAAPPAQSPRGELPLEPLAAGERGHGRARARASEPAAVLLASDFVRWIVAKVGTFPRKVRYGLWARIEAAHLDVLEELIAAQYARGPDRTRSLERANLRLQVSRHFVRVAREMNLFDDLQMDLLAERAATSPARRLLHVSRPARGCHS